MIRCIFLIVKQGGKTTYWSISDTGFNSNWQKWNIGKSGFLALTCLLYLTVFLCFTDLLESTGSLGLNGLVGFTGFFVLTGFLEELVITGFPVSC